MPRAKHRRHRARLFHRKGSPYWWAEYTTAQGAIVRQSTGCREDGAAQEWLAARTLERVRAEAGIPQARRVTVLQALAEYQEAREPFWSTGWAATVDAFLRNQVVPWFGERILSTVTRPEAEAFRRQQIGRPSKRGRGAVGPATVNRMMAALAAFGEWAADPERAYLLQNPFAKHSPLDEGDPPAPSLEPAEVEAFLGALPEQRRYRGRVYPVRAILTLAVDTGLRKGELQRLRWEDIDLPRRHLSVVSSWQRGTTKAKRTREQALTRRAVDVLRALGPLPSGLVFGKVGDLRRSIRTAAEKAGLGHLWFHAARHIGASRAGAAGATLPELMAWGGWSSPRMVRRYAHADHRRLLALADKMESGGQPADNAPPANEEGGLPPENRPQTLS